MSNEPSNAQKLIAEVLREHRIAYLDQFICTRCKESFGNAGEATAHQSAEVDKALGGLTRKRRIDYQWRETGEVHHDRFFEGKPVPKTRLHYVQQSRFASGWTVTE